MQGMAYRHIKFYAYDEVDVDVFIGKGYFCLPISDIKSAILIYNTTLLPDGWFSLLQVTENRIG